MQSANKTRCDDSTAGDLGDAAGGACGALVVGHGTRDPDGRREFLDVVRQTAGRIAPGAVEPAFLELAEPTIDQAVDRLAARGVRRIVVAPLLLFAAGHVRRDVPEAVRSAAGRYGFDPSDVRLTPHLGCEPKLVSLSVRRYREIASAVDPRFPGEAPATDAETLLLLVGRGGADDEARAEFLRFAELRRHAAPCGEQTFAFTAMSEPSLTAGLQRAGESAWRRIVVQPHLLFRGQLIDRLQDAVDEARRRYPEKQWLAAPHLGAAPEVVELLASRLGEGFAVR